MEFQTAISTSQSLLAKIEADQLSATEILAAISELVKTENGARGFFVTYLTSDRPLADHPTPEIIQALATNPEIVAQLLVKNLAMSTAMILTHEHNNNEEMAKSSAQVRQRSANLITMIQLPIIFTLCQEMLTNIYTNTGKYQEFFTRWGYDDQQKKLIAETLTEISAKIST